MAIYPAPERLKTKPNKANFTVRQHSKKWEKEKDRQEDLLIDRLKHKMWWYFEGRLGNDVPACYGDCYVVYDGSHAGRQPRAAEEIV